MIQPAPDLSTHDLQDRKADPLALAASARFRNTAEAFNNTQKAWQNWRLTSLHDKEI